MLKLVPVSFAAAIVLAAMSPASAMPIAPIDTSSAVTLVAQGCGPGAWRGPWGGCRDTPYSGPTPGGGYTVVNNGCPPGFWRGPWGNCRDTIYHGPLPGGGYK